MPSACTDPKTTHLRLRWQDTEVIAALEPVTDFTDVLPAEQQVTATP